MLRWHVASLSLCGALACASAHAEPFAPVELTAGYAGRHPRLLFRAEDKDALREKTSRIPDLWAPVLQQARGLGGHIPDRDAIRTGAKYWRAEWILSGALAAWLTDDAGCGDDAAAWMVAHCREDTWGVGWRENIDLQASWYLYYIALSYDLLFDRLSADERDAIRKGLEAHARAIYDARETGRQTYDQNHTYIPATALATAALALADETPDAALWLAYSRDLMDKCRRVLPPDGYYYEGTGYWEYALHWHVRYADVLARATGASLHDLPFFRNNTLYPLHLSLPGPPWLVDIGDAESRPGARTAALALGRKGILYRYASVFRDGVAQALAERYREQGAASEDPAMTFLWYDPSVAPTDLAAQPTHHHFEDFGVVTWRSSWDADATVCMFKCGPSSGYSAADGLAELPTWRPNTGHVHPDIGMFWIHARGAYLAGDTGYTSRKKTRDHNTLLVDGKGMGADGTYWVYSGFPDRDIPYSKWTPARIEKLHLEHGYAYAMGDFSTVYPEELGRLTVRRHFVATRDFIVVRDELGGDRPHEFTWLLHADNAFEETAPRVFETTLGGARLTAHVLRPAPPRSSTGPAMVFQKGKPHEGVEEPRGHELALTTDGAVPAAEFVVVLVPAQSDAPRADVAAVSANGQGLRFDLTHPGERARKVHLDWTWQPAAGGRSADGKGPLTLE